MPSLLDPNPFQSVPRGPVERARRETLSLPSLATVLIVAMMAFAAGFIISESTNRWVSNQEINAINQSYNKSLDRLAEANIHLSEQLQAEQQRNLAHGQAVASQ